MSRYLFLKLMSKELTGEETKIPLICLTKLLSKIKIEPLLIIFIIQRTNHRYFCIFSARYVL